VLFDAMRGPREVSLWFKQGMNDYFAEWPRRGRDFSLAIKGAMLSRHRQELDPFLAALDKYLNDPAAADPFSVPLRYELHLTGVTVLRPGPNGARLYLRGRGDVPGLGARTLYVYLDDAQQTAFDAGFDGQQQVIVQTSEISFSPGQGGAIRNVEAWTFA
jgi:hypothetical protein